MTKGDNSKRGLASADKETRERVARAGGEASHGGTSGNSSESTHERKAEAGRKGGER